MRPTDQEHVDRIFERAQRRQQRREAMRAEIMAGPGAMEESFAIAADAEPPLLVAEGDSWFDFPGTDVLEELEDVFGYQVESVAHAGDTLESIAHHETQLDGVERRLRKIAEQEKTPKAILLSGGGNDIAGDEFALLLNHRQSGLPTLNEDIMRGLIDVRLRAAYLSLISKVGAFCLRHFGRDDIPVVVHGYDRPVPDGRGFLGGFSILPGPWLKPGFDSKGYLDMLEANTGVMGQLIDRFNDMVGSLSTEPGFAHVHHADFRGILPNDLVGERYREFWSDELHPEGPGFMAVAAKIHEIVRGL